MKLAEAYVDITTRTKKFMAGLRMVRTKLTASMRRMAGIAKQWGRRIGIALAAAFTAAIWAATKFEEQMANVSTMLTETTMKAMKGFEKGIKRLAVAFGQGTATLAKGLYDILSAGIAASKGMAVLETASRAAIAGMTDTAAAVDVITTMLNSYQLSASEAGRVSDALFATVKAGKLTFAELARFMGMVAAPAAAAGEKMEELLAALATLTRAGVRPRIAVTYLRQALMAFSKSTPEAMKAAEKFGFTLETETLRTIGLVGVLKKLQGARAEELAAIFSSNEAYNAMITLRGDMVGLERDLAAQYKATGSTLEAYNKIAETAAQWFKRLKEVVLDIARAFGKPFLGPLKLIAAWFIHHKNTLKLWAEKGAIHVLYLAGVLKNFWQHTDFKGKWKSMLDSILIMLKGFVKVAVVLAVAAGKGIYRGVKEGLLGAGERRISASARERYEAIGGGWRRAEKGEESQKTGRLSTGGSRRFKLTAVDQRKWWAAMATATAEESARVIEPILGPAWQKIKNIMVESADKVNEAMEKPLDAAGLAAKQYLEQWRTYKLALIDYEAGMEDATKALEDETEGRKSLFQELQRPEKEKEKEKGEAQFLGLAEFARRIQLTVSPKVKTEAEKLQERQLALQRQQLAAAKAIQKTLETIRGGPSGMTLARG